VAKYSAMYGSNLIEYGSLVSGDLFNVKNREEAYCDAAKGEDQSG
jgi:hypothetical protein